MVLELAKQAVEIKMKLSFSSVFTSEYEYSYASGFVCRINSVPEAAASEMRNLTDFEELKNRTKQVAAGPQILKINGGEKLQKMIMDCTFSGKINDDTRALFDMGYGK